MYRGVAALAIASLALTGPFSFQEGLVKKNQQSWIEGRVSPANQAVSVLVVSKRDSASANVVAGHFLVKVKPGRYSVIIVAPDQSCKARLNNVEVKKNQALNLGEILVQ